MQTTEPRIATSIRATAQELVICLDGQDISLRWENCSKKLAKANDTERCQLELSPGGYGIHWPLLDEDLSIGGLLASQES